MDASPWAPRATALAVVAAWAIAVPWLAAAVGLELDVSTTLEIVDHVVPGALALSAAGVLLWRARRGQVATAGLVAGAVAFLAGFWITATHVPLIAEAADGAAPWGAALLHLSTGPPVAVLGLWLLLTSP